MSSTPRFHSLRLAEKRRETTDAVSLTFDIPAALCPAYRFTAGQYLTLRTTIDGQDLRRSYSICAAPSDGELRIAVKKVEGGLVSSWLCDTLQPGDRIDVMTPTGRFGLTVEPSQSRLHVGFAAGSGITPILSIIRHILAQEPRSRVVLFYGNRSTADMLFREALEDLKDRHVTRFSVFHVLSREQQDVEILNGHLDAEKIDRLLRHMIPADRIDHAFLCGPTRMSDDIEATLRQHGVPSDRIHTERFVSALGGQARKPAPLVEQAPYRTITLIADGKRADVPITDTESVLDAALRHGLDLAYACKGGMCSTCRARVIEGATSMDVNYALEPWELEAGFILTCQAHPTTDRVVIDFDAV